MRSASTAVARRAKRAQPTHNISDSHIPHLRILSILCQHFVAFNHRDQEARSLFRNQVAADCSLILPPPQSHGDAFLPAMEDSLQSLRNCSSSSDISCAKLTSGQPFLTSLGRAGIACTMPINASIGSLSLLRCRGRDHLSRVIAATISSIMAYPRASLLSKW